MATVAVFLALGGGAYAVASLPKNSVGTKQIKDRAVTKRKIAAAARHALRGRRGAPGSARAYAHVLANGKLDAVNSKNVSSSYEAGTSGEYCLKVAVPFKNAVASGDAAGTSSFVGADVSHGDIAFSCTHGAANVFVAVFTSPGVTAPNPFYIIFN